MTDDLGIIFVDYEYFSLACSSFIYALKIVVSVHRLCHVVEGDFVMCIYGIISERMYGKSRVRNIFSNVYECAL